MDKDPTGYLNRALHTRFTEVLQRNADRTDTTVIEVPPVAYETFGASEITISRDNVHQRTVCDVLKLPSADEPACCDTFIVWDDGRDASFRTDVQMSVHDFETLYDVDAAMSAIQDELRPLAMQNHIIPPEAARFLTALSDDLIVIIEAADEQLGKTKERDHRSNEQIIHEVLSAHRKSSLLTRMLQIIGSDALDQLVETLYDKRCAAVTMRANVSDAYDQARADGMTLAESGGCDQMQAGQAWYLIDMLDTIDET